MILKALKYTRYLGESNEWSITGKENEFAYFGNINLLVGKNASGKSRTLNVIREVANLLSGNLLVNKLCIDTQRFQLIFSENDTKYEYFLDIKNKIVVDEILSVNGKEVLNRRKNTLTNKKGFTVPLTLEDHQLAITETDKYGEPYFRSFILWGKSLKNYFFSNQNEKNHLVQNYMIENKDDKDVEDTSVLLNTFYKGKESFGKKFTSEIKSDMKFLGYYLSDISIEKLSGGYGICVEEDGRYIVTQIDMAQGMFRTLSLFIMLTYARLSNLSLCILVDDMGEGVDFDRSKILIDIAFKKIAQSNIQFMMTSNDRNIMNQIPLKHWSVIDRDKSKSVFYDYTNSKETFDDFKYTGLNNFEFISTDFYKNGFGDIEEGNDE